MKINVEKVSRYFGSVQALRDVELELDGGIVGLLGPNGAGKTTFLRLLATLLAPSEGRVSVGGWNASNPRERLLIRRRLGYLPQDLGLYPNFTVFEFVDYIAILKQLKDSSERHRKVRQAISAVELEDLVGRKIRTLSGGMRRRVGLAQALVADPDLLLLDEPTTGLDPAQRARFRQLMAGLGDLRTVLLSTHLVEDVAQICTYVVVLLQGSVAFRGTPADLRSLAEGMVWNSDQPAAGLISWRTEQGTFRVVGARPTPDATPVQPTVEDGYLLLASGNKAEAA